MGRGPGGNRPRDSRNQRHRRPPLHHASGVNYAIVEMCAGTLRCVDGAMVTPGGAPARQRKAWKANFNDDLDLDKALPAILRALEGDNASRVAPFRFVCEPLS